jgi:hypothetical protein
MDEFGQGRPTTPTPARTLRPDMRAEQFWRLAGRRWGESSDNPAREHRYHSQERCDHRRNPGDNSEHARND